MADDTDTKYIEHILNVIGIVPLVEGNKHAPVKWPDKPKRGVTVAPIAKPGEF